MKETNKENSIATYMNSSFQASKKYSVFQWILDTTNTLYFIDYVKYIDKRIKLFEDIEKNVV